MDDDRTTFKVLDALRSTTKFEPHAMKQAHSLKPMLSGISEQDAGEVSRLIVDVGFPESVESMLLSVIDIGDGVLPAGKDGTLQKWESFLDYGTQHFWDQVCANGANANTILKVIVTFLLSIGLRHPSCPTFRMITCLYCWIVHGEDTILNWTKADKYNEVQHVKQYFALRRDCVQPPCECVVMLPRMQSDFVKLYPSLSSVYKGNPAVACPLDTQMLLAFAESFPLRKPKGSTFDSWGIQMPQQAVVPAKKNLQWDGMSGQGAFMHLMQMNGVLMRQLAHEKGATLSSRDGGSIQLDMAPPKKKPLPLRDLIAEGPPATPPMPPAVPPPVGHTAEPSLSVMKVKKRMKKKKKKAILQTLPTNVEPAASENSKLTEAALGACSGVLEGLLHRDEAKKKAKKPCAVVHGKGDGAIVVHEKRSEKAAALGKKMNAKKIAALGKKMNATKIAAYGKTKSSKKPPLGCSKCRYLKNGCGRCRSLAAAWGKK